MSRFEFAPTPLPGVTVVQRQLREDDRGYLSRFYCAEEFGVGGLAKRIAQINHTLTRRRGTVRGLHFQRSPHAEAKIVSCLRGEIFDVAVDLRRSSPTFLAWYGVVLSEANHRSLLVPEGFAHGFQALTDDCEILYLVTAPYAPEAEGGLLATDPRIGVQWPLPITDMSDRDRSHALITDAFMGPEVAGTPAG